MKKMKDKIGNYILRNDENEDDDDDDEDDWKYYTRFSIGSMSSDSTISDPQKNATSIMNYKSKELQDSSIPRTVVTKQSDSLLLLLPDHCTNAVCHSLLPPPPTPPSSLNILSSSWSIYVCHNDTTTATITTTTTIFRLVRNSESSSALYLHGMEIIHAIDAIYHRDPTVTFTIVLSSNQNINDNHKNDMIKELYVADDMTDIRTKLYSLMVPSEITCQARPRPAATHNDDRSNVFRWSSLAECRDWTDHHDCDLGVTQVRRRADSHPMIESKMEFDDDDDDDDEIFDSMIDGIDLDNTENDGIDLWDSAMIHDVVSSLMAIGIHDTSMSSSLWTTLSSSSSSSSYTTDNDSDSGSEMEMVEI